MEIWSNKRIELRGGKMIVEASVRFDADASGVTVGYVYIGRVYAWSGPTMKDRDRDYDLTRYELGYWLGDLTKIVDRAIEKQLHADSPVPAIVKEYRLLHERDRDEISYLEGENFHLRCQLADARGDVDTLKESLKECRK